MTLERLNGELGRGRTSADLHGRSGRSGALAIASAGLLWVATALPADAALNRAGNPNAPPLSIVFKPDQSCWRYTGREAFFRGSFRAFAHIIVTAAGELHTIDPATGREMVQMQMRDVFISPARGALKVEDAGKGEFVIPETGLYDISLWPHVMQGNPGMVVICKR
jgi:hypothetical protein